MSVPPLVVISILNWNGWQDTLECLESVRRLDYLNYLTVVVDNGSWNDSADKIKVWAEENLGPAHVIADYTRQTALAGGIPETEQALQFVRSPARMVLVRNEENLGFTGGNNVSIDYALNRRDPADYVFLLNNDAVPDRSTVSELVSVAHRTGAGLVGARIRNGATGEFEFSAWAMSYPLLREFFYPLLNRPFPRMDFEGGSAPCYSVHGAAMLLAASTLRKIYLSHGRYLDPALFMYADELELGHVVQEAGDQARTADHAAVNHRDDGRGNGRLNNRLFQYYSRRNTILLARRLLPAWSRWPFHLWTVAVSLKRIVHCLLRQNPQSARVIAWGWLDGYWGVTGRWREHDLQACKSAGPIEGKARRRTGAYRAEWADVARPKIAIAHPGMGISGSAAEVMWCIDALKRDCDVTLITYGRVSLGQLNSCFGTDVKPADFDLHAVRMPLGLHRSGKFRGLQGAYFSRYVHRVAPEFDAIISGYNPCDFGVTGIQLIGDFSFAKDLYRAMHPPLREYRKWWYGNSLLRRAYLTLCRWIWKPDPDGWRRNITVANSDWTRELLRKEFGIKARTVYNPVPEGLPSVSWANRENGFVYIGKIVPEKRPDAAIRVLDAVRRRGHDVHLHILGELDESPCSQKVRQLARKNRDWISLEGLANGDKKKTALAAHRYGLHVCENEAFGIAPAEMVKAGAITFVPASGGQAEIVNHPALTFNNEEDAVNKICAVLSSDTIQQSLRRHLSEQALKFSVESFVAGFRQVVFEFLNHPVPQTVNHGHS